MSDRQNSGGRGKGHGRGSSRGGGSGRGRGRGSSTRGGSTSTTSGPASSIQKQMTEMGKLVDKKVKVKFNGGREVVGILKGFDTLLNLVLDECLEYEKETTTSLSDKTREIGLVVCRGTMVFMICPMDGTEEIENPFLSQQDQAE